MDTLTPEIAMVAPLVAVWPASVPDTGAPGHVMWLPYALTRREREVLSLLVYRQTDQEIAERLSISRRTASAHVARILDKLGVPNRREAARVVLAAGTR